MSEPAPPFSFDCHRCGNCCRVGHGQVWFEQADLPAMAKIFGIGQDVFVNRFVRRVGDRLSILENPDGSCSLLDGDSHCSIYEVRPKQCRDFPYWPQFAEDSRAFELAAGYCQGIQRYPNQQTLRKVLPLVAQILDGARPSLDSGGTGDGAEGERWGSSLEVDLYLASAQEWRIVSPPAIQEVRQQLEALAAETGYPWSVGPWERILVDRRGGWMASGGLPSFAHES